MDLTKRMLATAALVSLMALAACDGSEPQAPVDTPNPASQGSDTAADSPGPGTSPVDVEKAAVGADGIPVFAALYPDAELSAPATRADGPDGPGGLVAFTTSAAPDVVVDYYKQRAEGAGLTSISAMNQGEARAYAAASPDGGGASVQVVAAPTEDGTTSVQLSWSAGR